MESDENSSVAFLYKAMRNRDPRKRQVKPVQKHLIQTSFGGDDSENDSDYQVDQNDSSEEEVADTSLDEKQSEGSEAGSPENTQESDESQSESESQSDSDSTEEEEEERTAKKGGNLFDAIDSDDEDDEDYVPCKKQKQGKKKQPAEKQRIKSPEITQTAIEEATTDSTRPMKVLICCVCLGDISEDDDEIVECDNCGVAVHEGCYGISDNQSIASTESSASTEPWYCDACKAGVKPDCELCPNTGGIFKETDAGKWVHLVCALYTPGVAFGDVDKLSPVTLFEMPYSRWGLKECSLCEDLRFSRTGVCISCDAGLCRSYFHVTCAQREGLLSEASPEEVMDIADPFFAYCKLHADKNATKAKRRHWLAIQSHVRQHAQTDIQDEKEKTRFERKLNRHRQKYNLAKAKRPPAWVPTQKMVRYLTSSPSAVKQMLRKAELMGIITQSTHVVSHQTEKQELRKKSHVPAAFSNDFITHYLDRNMRIENMRASLKDLMAQNQKLRDQEKVLRSQYDKLLHESEKAKDPVHKLRKEGEKVYTILGEIIGKSIPLPEILRPKKVHKSPVRREIPKSPTTTVINKCGICCKTHDQHLLARCDSCKLWYHLGCLNPPLTRMPKKTSNYGWQCSECTPSSSEESVEGSSVNVNAPRRLREKIKEPAKFSRAKENMEALFPQAKKGKKNSKQRKKVRRKEKPKEKQELITNKTETDRDESPVLEEVSKDDAGLAFDEDRGESPICIDDEEEIVVSDSNSLDVDIKIIEETTPVKMPPMHQQDVSRTGRRRIKKKRYSTDSDEVQKLGGKKRSLSTSPGEQNTTITPKKHFGSECITCGRPGDRTNMVSCDACELCYHFSCLDPPFKKTPKQRGYSWYCEACDASDTSENEDDT